MSGLTTSRKELPLTFGRLTTAQCGCVRAVDLALGGRKSWLTSFPLGERVTLRCQSPAARGRDLHHGGGARGVEVAAATHGSAAGRPKVSVASAGHCASTSSPAEGVKVWQPPPAPPTTPPPACPQRLVRAAESRPLRRGTPACAAQASPGLRRSSSAHPSRRRESIRAPGTPGLLPAPAARLRCPPVRGNSPARAHQDEGPWACTDWRRVPWRLRNLRTLCGVKLRRAA